MLLANEKLWKILERKTEKYDNDNPSRKQSAHDFLSAIDALVKFAFDRAKTIRDTFPLYTLHDDTHIVNVMDTMILLLGDKIEEASREEIAMLILSACCHDLGMSYSKEERDAALKDRDSINEYLEKDAGKYAKAYANGNDAPILSEEMSIDYFRSIHHVRVKELLENYDWPDILGAKVACQDLIRICQSHGQDVKTITDMKTDATTDLRLCAIVLRLADILDFDASRTPTTLYTYTDFHHENISTSDKISLTEWKKHRASYGFDFDKVGDRDKPYLLPYRAICENLQLEQDIISYLNWVDDELTECNKLLPYLENRWKTLILPSKIDRNIESKGYESGQFKLTLEQDEVLNLLVGKAIYSDPTVFVRELLQNSIDAVRTRKQLDKNLSKKWKPQITINTWLDNDGYHWFCINDNGLGMNKDIILNYFLKVGKSYYKSDAFISEKIKSDADSDYMPISRFGIGILSCFMGDGSVNRVEVSTRRYEKNSPPLRLSMHGLNGYYCLTNKKERHKAPDITDEKLKQHMVYREDVGTTIAVRTNLYRTGQYTGFKEILDKYICYPEIPIHYIGKEGHYDYVTETDFMQHLAINPDSSDNQYEIAIPMSSEHLEELKTKIPELTFIKPPQLILKMFNLAELGNSPYLAGALLMAKSSNGEYEPFKVEIGEEKIDVEVKIHLQARSHILYLGVELVFPEHINTRMKYLSEKMENNLDAIINAYKRIAAVKQYEKIQREILKEFDGVEDCEYFWTIDDNRKNEMCKNHTLSMDELDLIIEGVKKDMSEIMFCIQNDDEERDLITQYNEINSSYSFKVYDLSTNPCYKKYFQRFDDKENVGIIAHNGILCGDATLFCNEQRKQGILGCFVLLKDKYRPEVDIARDSVKKLPLLALAHLDFVRSKIYKEIKFYNKLKQDFISELQYLPMQAYVNIIDNNEEWLKELTFETEYGNVSLIELHSLIASHQKVKIKNINLLYFITSWNSSCNIAIEKLLFTILQQEFTLRYKKEPFNVIIFAFKKEQELSPAHLYFPPAFFVQTIEDRATLVNKIRLARHTCNENHPFSQFLLNNVELLLKYTPGIFSRIIYTLAEGNDLCDELNECITLLRSVHAIQDKIPNELHLTEKDFF